MFKRKKKKTETEDAVAAKIAETLQTEMNIKDSASLEADEAASGTDKTDEAVKIESTSSLLLETQKEKEKGDRSWVLSKEDFGPLYKYVADDNLTDVDWDCDSLWIKAVNRVREKVDDPEVTKDFIYNFIDKVAIHESARFTPMEKSFSAETDTLRITCVHEALSPEGRCVNIRKTLPRLRFTAKQAINEQYAAEEVLAFLINSVKMRANIVFCGYPGCGKTEAAKFFSSFIEKNRKVITVEDTKEWHYKKINPGADGIEFKVKSSADYEEALAEALRLSPSWLMISEARSKEVEYLKKGMTSGVHCITTLHVDDVQKIPSRMANMMETTNKKHEIDDMYTHLDFGVHLVEKADAEGYIHREIDQIGYFERDLEHGKNKCHMIMNKGVLHKNAVPESLRARIQEMTGEHDIFKCRILEDSIAEETAELAAEAEKEAESRVKPEGAALENSDMPKGVNAEELPEEDTCAESSEDSKESKNAEEKEQIKAGLSREETENA